MTVPSIITPAGLGPKTFSEDWSSFDQGIDGKHRWRTVLLGGDDIYSRQITAESFCGDKTLGVEMDPFVHRPGTLIMQCKRVPEAQKGSRWGSRYKYVGSQINTKMSFSQLYGYFEIVARLPAGKGAFPSFWMLPIKGAWPANGEIDVFEQTGNSSSIYTSIHSTKVKGGQVQGKCALGFDASVGVHRYGVAWTADEIVWFVDRKEVFRTKTPNDMKQVPMFLLLWLGASHPWDNDRPDASTPWPMQMAIYNVSAWELAAK